MDKEPLIKLDWQGHETVATITKLLGKAKQIEIALPINYNHALFRTLYPNARPTEPETIDTTAGLELLTDVAAVSGLEELATLTEALGTTHARVQIVSPPTVIITLPPENDAK